MQSWMYIIESGMKKIEIMLLSISTKVLWSQTIVEMIENLN